MMEKSTTLPPGSCQMRSHANVADQQAERIPPGTR